MKRNHIKENEKKLSKYMLSIVGYDKVKIYVCMSLAGVVAWLILFKDDVEYKSLFIIFFGVVSFTFILYTISIILNLEAFKRESEEKKVGRFLDIAIIAIRYTSLLFLISSITLAIVLYGLNI